MAAILSPEDSREFSSFLDTIQHEPATTHLNGNSNHHHDSHHIVPSYPTISQSSTSSSIPSTSRSAFSAFLFPDPSMLPPPPSTASAPVLHSNGLNGIISSNAEPSTAFPSHSIHALDQDKLDRMAQQTRELAQWMNARGVASSSSTTTMNTSSDTPSTPNQYYYQQRQQQPETMMSAQRRTRQASGELKSVQSPPKRGRSDHRNSNNDNLIEDQNEPNGNHSPLLWAPPPPRPNQGSSSSSSSSSFSRLHFDDIHNGRDELARLKAAEDKVQFAQRYSSGQLPPMPLPIPRPLPALPSRPRPSDSIVKTESPPRALSNKVVKKPYTTEMMIKNSPKTMRKDQSPSTSKASAKTTTTGKARTKSTNRASTSTTILDATVHSGLDSDSSLLNPAPALTPSNIPAPSPRVPYPSIPKRVLPQLNNDPPPSSQQSSTSTPLGPTSNAATTTTTKDTKPALLSAEQKKANHIASEQKRRAAIRNGYETLCHVVPSLRAAVEEFDERVKKLSASNNKTKSSSSEGRRRPSQSGGISGPLSGGIEVGGEKVDGRAGPKSEAVVLGKTVDHLRDVLETRKQLLDTLSNLYIVAGERGVVIDGGHRVWEEKWED